MLLSKKKDLSRLSQTLTLELLKKKPVCDSIIVLDDFEYVLSRIHTYVCSYDKVHTYVYILLMY